MTPNYKKMYEDILHKKHPEKKDICSKILSKKNLSALDIIKLNKIIFGTKDNSLDRSDQKLRSYKKTDILKVLDFQKKENLNNTQLARYYNLSRNTITKWKKLYQ